MLARAEALGLVAARVFTTQIGERFVARFSPNVMAAAGHGRRTPDWRGPVDPPVDVVVHFADAPMRLYQLEQWLPVLERLAERRSVCVLTRMISTFRRLDGGARVPVVYANGLHDLEAVLGELDPKVCIYVNNSFYNFQPLSWRRALHVHVNHGESDKVSMASNQAKAYDAVFVAGEAAEQRYRDNLIAFDGETVVRVGRPQLDFELPSPVAPSGRRTILYAPTWEGETHAMDYSSVRRYGPAIARALGSDERFRVVYKPHPRVATGTRAMAEAHRETVRALEAANRGRPESDWNRVDDGTEVLALFSGSDALVADVSSVALDWLYLRTDAPLWLCDPYGDRARLERASPAAAAADVLDGETLPRLADAIAAGLDNDARRAARDEARRFYFGDLAPGDSMARFLDAVDELATRRDQLLAERRGAVGLETRAGVA